MHKVADVQILEGRRVHLRFADGAEGDVDLAGLAGKGVFAAWEDEGAFQAVTIGEAGELRWGDEIELCPDSLYMQATGKTPEQVFPTLRQEAVDA